MKEKFDKLKALGCDVDGALERFLGDEQLYLMMHLERVTRKAVRRKTN